MKTITLTLTIAMIGLMSSAQEKNDLTVSIGTGVLNSPYYLNDMAKGFYSVDFNYYLASRHILSANFNSGRHEYYEDVLSNTAGSIKSNGTNAKALYQTFSILYKYNFLHNNVFSGNFGTGAGIMTHTQEYPYAENNASIYRQSSWTDLVFPVRLEFDCKLSNHFQLGVIGGFFIHPDYPVLAYYAGPRFSYLLK